MMAVQSSELLRFAEGAGFIFRGKVTSQQARVAQEATEQKTVTAQIEEVLLSTDVLRGLAGKSVTVISEHPESMDDGGSYLFFTNCIVLADYVVVRERGHVRDSQEARRETDEVLQEMAERPLAERVRSALLIIEGHVTASSPADPNHIQKSEHDPKWWIARVAVESLIKGGSKSVKTLEVLFANSKDIAWYKSPKLHEGVRGIFLLHAITEGDRPPRLDRSIYKAIDPLDFLPSERMPEVRRALNREQGAQEKGGR
jgi:hypothetical protein